MTQGPYHLFSIGLLLILFYLLSLIGIRMQLLSRNAHKKFWNTLLLLFFLSAAILGLLLAVKVNYKLDISWIEGALQWHVDLGIGFAFVSGFHLSWHLGYFKKFIFRRPKSRDQATLTRHLAFSSFQGKLLFVLLGYLSMVAQLVLLREFIKTFHGNELVIGIFLAIWMMITSAGAWAGSGYLARLSKPTILRTLLLLGGAPLIIYLLLVLINRFFFLPGYEPGMIVSITFVILLTGVFTLVSGFLFSYMSRSLQKSSKGAAYYMLDSVGSLTGGIIFGLILVFLLDNIQVLSFLFLSGTSAVILIYKYPLKPIPKVLMLVAGVFLFTWLLFPGNRNKMEALRFKGQIILETQDTPFGNLTVTETDGQVNLYVDRNPVLSSFDLVRSEESVHYPALQHPSPGSFLLLGGGMAGHASEIRKYNPVRFDYCEADPAIFRIGSKYLPASKTNGFNFIPMDGRRWLQKANGVTYDVIISTAADPLTLGWNRYFTSDFYQMVKDHLTAEGIFSMQLSAGGEYLNEEGNELLSINYHTLKQVFDHVTIVPGYASYFLASDQPLSLDFPTLLRQHNIPTTYVHPDYLDVTHLMFDADLVMARIERSQPTSNSDLWPRLFFTSLNSLEARMGSHSLALTGIISVLFFIVLLLSYRPLQAGMYVTGFTGAGIQILLIMVFQSLYGFAYLAAPIMITVFMSGLIVGAMKWNSIFHTPSQSKYTGLLWLMAIVAAAGVVGLKTESIFNNGLNGQLFIALFNFMPGMIVGAVYGMSLALNGKGGVSNVGRLYSADLAGAALGTFMPALFILPLLGITNTFILFCGINVATGLIILTRWR